MTTITKHIATSIRPKPSILLIGKLHHSKSEWSALQTKYKTNQFTGNRHQFLQNCQSGIWDGVAALYRTNSTLETGPFDKELIHSLPLTLKFICLNGAGYDGMDIETCTERGIRVSNTPKVVADATADVAMFLMLGALRQAMIPLVSIRNGQWKGDTPLGRDPGGKVLGILGMGAIGQAIAHRARAFGLKIIYHNRSKLARDKEGDAEYVTFDELLRHSDIISLNLPATKKTCYIISKAEFEKMKDDVVIINTARGSLLDEAALVEALQADKVASAGLDVFENEPIIHPGLLHDNRVMILPHIGTTTRETKREMELLTLRNIENALDDGKLLTPIIEQQEGQF
ncbi:putative 2-hydroxyacid dehydrogenase [Aspergillus flavus]|uniref:D-isomer specific 2-hydroxyacid dehydrogenase NAD-binding protein n=2 Tax=Aspergillus oryzae TaxID=5062 RepID=A0A1S9DQ65_ASPOZ|nr:glyoxylate/hydroxypyruvate reductase [Aspergillus oryzae 3.042]KDE76493.1 glyoxylate/hydroxypyruvate reductase [Aspergillus oryzae 100-8]OOO11026.1 D-isomer specific 2-hydroxyacid dehydrogenase NAD-binding protein [Aspergillus oryzae]RAQ64497.1 putative 2-hydroxyacid dehydrogenase [Aspergillus flavus]RAQ65778.1 putative 2-hydroxyacid dehydrogenase [Aspergillus flavus]|eukprot:EIT76102.1 glyoxylate/hydroxypyruvate reductase [Aspergillus oryzae 3.042]